MKISLSTVRVAFFKHALSKLNSPAGAKSKGSLASRVSKQHILYRERVKENSHTSVPL